MQSAVFAAHGLMLIIFVIYGLALMIVDTPLPFCDGLSYLSILYTFHRESHHNLHNDLSFSSQHVRI